MLFSALGLLQLLRIVSKAPQNSFSRLEKYSLERENNINKR